MDHLKLDQYPVPALLCREGAVADCNDKAALLPGIRKGEPVPEEWMLPEEGTWESRVPLGGALYRMRSQRTQDGYLLLLEEESQQALSQGQLDASLYQVRRFMGQMLRQIGPAIRQEGVELTREDREQFSKQYYQMLRLMDHLDLLRDAAGPGGLVADMESLDLAQLCAQLARESDGVLDQIGVRVAYDGPEVGLYTRGDRELLRSAILEILSNSARQCGNGGTITMKLRQQGGRASLLLQDNGPALTNRQRQQMGERRVLPGIPRPGEGAGLGLSVADAILRRHGGLLAVGMDGERARVWMSLPLRRGGGISLRSPRPERNAGMSQIIIALSDVLPGAVIYPDWEE